MNPRTRFKTSSGRRQWLGAAMTLVAGGLVRPVLGQPVSAAAEEAKAPPLPALGSTLAVPPVDLIGGGRFDPAQARGKPLLVYWWSSICPFCALQSPEMDAFWKAQQGRGLQMLALSIDKKPEEATAYLRKKGYSFSAAWLSPELLKTYRKPEGLPVTVVRGKDGRVAQAEKGQLFPEDVAQLARWL